MKKKNGLVFWACLTVFCHTTFLILTIAVLVCLKEKQNTLLYLCLLIGFSCELLGWLVTSVIYFLSKNTKHDYQTIEAYDQRDYYQNQQPPFFK